MRQFFKIFFASFLAMAVFAVVALIILVAWIVGLAGSFSADKPAVGGKAVLYFDLSQTIHEQVQNNPLSDFNADDQYDMPGLYDLVRLIKFAKTDSTVKGIYIKCADNANGFATSSELRGALQDFKASNKFIYA